MISSGDTPDQIDVTVGMTMDPWATSRAINTLSSEELVQIVEDLARRDEDRTAQDVSQDLAMHDLETRWQHLLQAPGHHAAETIKELAWRTIEMKVDTTGHVLELSRPGMITTVKVPSNQPDERRSIMRSLGIRSGMILARPPFDRPLKQVQWSDDGTRQQEHMEAIMLRHRIESLERSHGNGQIDIIVGPSQCSIVWRPIEGEPTTLRDEVSCERTAALLCRLGLRRHDERSELLEEITRMKMRALAQERQRTSQ